MTKILLVDDDPIILNTLGAGLTQLKYDVETCDCSNQAVDRFKNSPPDLVVIDFSMPNKNGIETAEDMIKHTYRPVIMLSAHNDLAIVREAIGKGISTYLVKPIEAQHLAPSIEAALARFQEVNALLKQGANIQDSMEKNRIINAAVGILMERAHLPNDLAFEKLRQLARKQRRSLQSVAFELVDALSTVNTIVQRTISNR